MVGGAEFQSQTPVQILTRMVYLVFMNQIKATLTLWSRPVLPLAGLPAGNFILNHSPVVSSLCCLTHFEAHQYQDKSDGALTTSWAFSY